MRYTVLMEYQQHQHTGRLSLRTRDSKVLLITNLLVLPGALFLGWNPWYLLLAWWLENVLLGIVNTLRILLLPAEPRDRRVFKLLLAGFFVLHYGGFCTGHALLLGLVFGSKEPFLTALGNFLAGHDGFLFLLLMLPAGIYSLVRHRKRLNAQAEKAFDDVVGRLMLRPYLRVFLLHVVLLLVAVPLQAIPDRQIAGVLFILGKTILDLAAHNFMEKKEWQP